MANLQVLKFSTKNTASVWIVEALLVPVPQFRPVFIKCMVQEICGDLTFTILIHEVELKVEIKVAPQ